MKGAIELWLARAVVDLLLATGAVLFLILLGYATYLWNVVKERSRK